MNASQSNNEPKNLYPYKNLQPNEFYMEIAYASYTHYGTVTDFKNFRGEPMPPFDMLPDQIKKAWHDAARHAFNMGQAFANKTEV